jgi:hypothetical protein
MTIELRYKPSEDVWFMHLNKPTKGFIDKIIISIGRSEKTITQYSVFSIPNSCYTETDLFQTKEALLQSL